MQNRKLMIDGVGIQVEDHGGSGEAILFLHFGGSNLRMWDPVLPFFANRYRCITLDLRAHGLSDAPLTGYHIDDMADDVIGVVNTLTIEQAHIVGSSIGAEVGLSLATNVPTRVTSLVAEGALSSEYGPYGIRAADSAAEDEEVKLQLKKRLSTPERTYESQDELVQEASRFYKECDMWNSAIEAVLSYGAVKDELGRVVNAWRKWASDAYMTLYFEYRFEQYYEQITCPVLMLPGEDDANDEQMLDIMTRLSKLPKQCEIVRVPGAIHPFGWMLNPKPMAQAVIDFHKRIALR